MVGVLPVSHGGTKPVLNPIYSLTLCLDDDSSVHYVLSYLFQAALIRAVYNILLFDLKMMLRLEQIDFETHTYSDDM